MTAPFFHHAMHDPTPDDPMKFLPLIASLMLVPPAFAQTAEPHSVFSLRGECQQLSIGDENIRDICGDEIMQVVYTDSMMELAIWTTDPSGRFLVFAGSVERTAEGLAQQIDRVIEGRDGSGDNNVEQAATGRCELIGNPQQGPARYLCEAIGKDGTRYTFAFLTDGQLPESMLD